jgi:hypothetical protein
VAQIKSQQIAIGRRQDLFALGQLLRQGQPQSALVGPDNRRGSAPRAID